MSIPQFCARRDFGKIPLRPQRKTAKYGYKIQRGVGESSDGAAESIVKEIKTMKKFTAILLLLTISVFAFASCAEEKGGESAEPSSVGTVSESGADVSEPSAEVSSADVSEESAPTSSEDVSDDRVIRVGGLKGPTTMGLVKLMEDASNGRAKLNYDFKVEAMPDMITPPLLKGELDMAAVPANLAAVLNNKTDGKIKVVAINTLGVLYIVQKNETIESLADLKGKTVYATGKGTTPEYALFYLLRQAGLDPEKDLTVEWKSEPTDRKSVV